MVNFQKEATIILGRFLRNDSNNLAILKELNDQFSILLNEFNNDYQKIIVELNCKHNKYFADISIKRKNYNSFPIEDNIELPIRFDTGLNEFIGIFIDTDRADIPGELKNQNKNVMIVLAETIGAKIIEMIDKK